MSLRGAICQNRFIAPVYTARFVRREPGPRPRGPLGPGAPVPVHRDAAPSSPVSPQGPPERCRLRVPSTRPGPHGAPSSPARAARSRSRSCRLPGASHGPHLPAVRSATPSCRCSRSPRECPPPPREPRAGRSLVPEFPAAAHWKVTQRCHRRSRSVGVTNAGRPKAAGRRGGHRPGPRERLSGPGFPGSGPAAARSRGRPGRSLLGGGAGGSPPPAAVPPAEPRGRPASASRQSRRVRSRPEVGP